MRRKRVDWEERHFQICLALLGRTSLDRFGRSMPPELTSTIAWADRMITLLKKRETERAANSENLSGVAK